MSNLESDDLAHLRDAEGFLPDDFLSSLSTTDPRILAIEAKIKDVVVGTTRYERIAAFLDIMLSSSGGGRESECSLIYGKSGVGKSTAIEGFCAGYFGPFETRRGVQRPVLLVQTPSRPTLGNLYESLLECLGMDEAIGKPNDMKRTFRAQVEIQGVKLVIFDEFTHVIEDKTEKFARQVAREIKGFLNDQLFNVVFAGTEALLGLYGIYDQLRRRNGGDLLITQYDWQDDDDQDEWIDFLECVSDQLPIAPKVSLHEPPIAEKLHRACDGNVNGLIKLLIKASTRAAQLGDTSLLEGHLAEGFDLVRTTLKKNPNVLHDGFGQNGTDCRNPFDRLRGRPSKPKVMSRSANAPTGLRSNGPKPSNRDTFTK